MEDLERIHTRLDNVKSVEPLLAALRTIAASSWHLARTRLAATHAFVAELQQILLLLKPRLPESVWRVPEGAPAEQVGVLVIASERGLCGSFNDDVLQGAERHISGLTEQGHRVELMALGARAALYFRRRGLSPLWSEGLPVTTIASLALARRVHDRLKEVYESGRFQQVYVIYMPYRKGFLTKPLLERLLPLKLPELAEETSRWPTPLIDAAPEALFRQARAQWSLATLYRCVVESAASEQAARFRMLDGASDNSQRLIEELTLNYHSARQQAITREMLDLASGAGLLKQRKRAQDS